MRKNNTFERAVKAFGAETQTENAVRILRRAGDIVSDSIEFPFARDVDQIAKTIAGVEIMLEQLKVVFDCSGRAKYLREIAELELRKKVSEIERGKRDENSIFYGAGSAAGKGKGKDVL